jgi:hypothetical protein
MSERQREILELFVEAQRLGQHRYHIGVIGNGGAHIFFRGEIAPQVAWRRKMNAETKALRARVVDPLPTPPEKVEPCVCGSIWEHRTASIRGPIHIGVRTKSCARAA